MAALLSPFPRSGNRPTIYCTCRSIPPVPVLCKMLVRRMTSAENHVISKRPRGNQLGTDPCRPDLLFQAGTAQDQRTSPPPKKLGSCLVTNEASVFQGIRVETSFPCLLATVSGSCQLPHFDLDQRRAKAETRRLVDSQIPLTGVFLHPFSFSPQLASLLWTTT